MGNLVTNRINFERADGAALPEAFNGLMAMITPRPFAEFSAELARATTSRTSVELPLDMRLARPAPEALEATRDARSNLLLGLALLSTPREDLVMAWSETIDPTMNDLPPAMVLTAHAVLASAGLAQLTPEARLAFVEAENAQLLEEARAAVAAWREAGRFDLATWQRDEWGMRAHADTLEAWIENGCLSIRFDTVNQGPEGWIKALAQALPDYHFSGVSYDEDTDYSLHFATDEPGEVAMEEHSDPDEVLTARAFVAGLSVDEFREIFCEDEDLDDDEIEP